MSIPILKVITEYCEVYVDDIRLQELALTNAPLYARKMWQYLRASLPLFTLPEGIQSLLFGTVENPNLIEPSFADTTVVLENAENSDFTVALGEEYAGYEICGCRIGTVDNLGNSVFTPIAVSYTAETGNVIVHATKENPIPKGATLSFDLYTDGYFTQMLSPAIMSIIGKCFNVVWQTRFMNDWLSNVDKVEDKSFSQQNRANKIRADQERYQILLRELSGEMRKLEQSIYYRNTFPIGNIKI